MQLLAACQKAPSIRRLVVKSSAAVYGSSPRDPAMFAEDMGPKALPRAGFGKDSVEVEGYVRGFSRRRADVEISMLRLANIVGPGLRTGLTDYLSLPVIPIPLGFDARIQLLHENDALRGLLLATIGPPVGIVNVGRRWHHHGATGCSPGRSARAPRAAVRQWSVGSVRQARWACRLLSRPDAVPRLGQGHGHNQDA